MLVKKPELASYPVGYEQEYYRDAMQYERARAEFAILAAKQAVQQLPEHEQPYKILNKALTELKDNE